MKLNDRYWLYAMECIPTGQLYIGQTGRPNPCWRWSEHFVALRNGTSHNRLLQAVWHKYPALTYWQFRVLDVVNGKWAANHREADLILDTPEEKRLNSNKTSTMGLVKRRRIESMLQLGCRYVDIRDTVGVSLGMISKIKRVGLTNEQQQISPTPLTSGS